MFRTTSMSRGASSTSRPTATTSQGRSGNAFGAGGSGSSTAGRTFSRVNSIKRDWGDEDEEGGSTKGSGRASSPIEWEPSPERAPRPLPPVRAAVPTGRPQALNSEAARERRRQAILAAMNENAATMSPESSIAEPSKPPVQVLPSLPSLPSSKRALPWESDGQPTKRSSSSRTSSKESSKSGGSTRSDSVGGPTINIKQRLTLSDEQKRVLQMVVEEGKNVFFTGSAGTGKSVLLREIIKSLRKKYVKAPDAVAVTASTGIAACNIGGVTLHSFGGCGLALEPLEVLVGKLKKNKKGAARWLRTKVLIIDEVSMVDGDLFDKLNALGKAIRKQQKPFGGIQIIVTGDFFQLPPVSKAGSQPKFAFDATTWKETIHQSVNLAKVWRQKDQRFVDMLNEMRFGTLTEASIQAFSKLSRPIEYDDGIEPTELFPRREDVDRANAARLAALNTDACSYSSTDTGTVVDPVQREKLLSNFMAPQFIELRINAQVMLIKNVDETLVNGSMGKVLGFCHKMLFNVDSQGRWKMDDDDDLDEDDEEGQRRRRMMQVLQAKYASGESKPCPVVRFKVPGGGQRDMLVEPDQFKNELPSGEVQVSRTQLPLILAWAMSIHKSQGQTLERVKVDLGKVFEKGQAYVALSRATSLEGLQVLGFKKEKVMAHPKVTAWSKQLQNLNY